MLTQSLTHWLSAGGIALMTGTEPFAKTAVMQKIYNHCDGGPVQHWQGVFNLRLLSSSLPKAS